VTFETLQIIFPYAAALAVVGMLESLMTATIIDDLTDTSSDKNRECKGQGIANIGAGLLGGMAGCAMIIKREAAYPVDPPYRLRCECPDPGK
jgi:SulP family sulfate permease